MNNFAGKLLAFVLIVQICTSQQNEQSSLLRCLTGYKDSNGKLSDCPPDRVLSKCVSHCPKTCQNPYIKSDNKECLRNCRSGCVCPKGTLIDEGRNRECVPQDECTCLHHGKVFMPDEILLRSGKKCQCKNGGWICHDQPISSRTCSIVGLTHLETFDGALLNVKPGHYLLVKSIDETIKNFRIEASIQKNFKRQLKFTIGINTVVLSDIHTIKLNDKHLEQLPYQTNDLTIRQVTSQFILIESKDMHIAYDGNAVYITLESFYRERVRGLCGSFDYNQDNDLRLPNGKLTCDTHIFSRAYHLNDTKLDDSVEENTPKKFDRPKAEKICHEIKDNVCKTGAYVHGLLLSCIEDQRLTQIKNSSRGSCYWHSIFAHACALVGHDIPQKHTKWRVECESVFSKCGTGMIYEECPISCLNSCSERDDEHELNSVCRQQCLAGCVCAKNHFYDANRKTHEPVKCNKEAECSCFDEQTKEYHKPGAMVKRGQCSTCICLRGQLHCNSEKCNKSSIICPNNLIFTETSLTACPKTCSNHLIWKNCHKYRSGCDCPTDMVRDEHTNRCVFPKHCSCKSHGKFFPYGSKITKDCNQCTCTSGQWSCTQLDCSRTCSILRNTHYTTFSGQYLTINSGSCEYTAARFRENGKKFTLTLSNHVSKEHVHSLKGQVTIDGVNISFESGKSIRVNDEILTKLASSPAHYSSFTIYKAGLFVVINGTHFILRWDHGNQIYLTIDSRWKEELDGVCSEHIREGKDVIVQKEKHINKWKVNSKCNVEVDKRKDDNEKWRWSHERCVAILNGTSSTKNPFSACLDKLNKERRKKLYKQCMEESCSCTIDAHDCASICSWFASLSELCRKEGHPIESWRREEFCPLTCGENEEYKACGTLCQKTCNDLDGTSTVKCYNDTCNEGCYCKEVYVLNHKGDCIKPGQCSVKTTQHPGATTRKSNASHTETTGVSTTMPTSSIGTTLVSCTETELIEILVKSNLIQIRPTDSSNKEDLISKGVDFTNQQSSIVIDIPNGGAIIRDVKLQSHNVVQIEVIFTTESGLTVTPIRGAPTSLSTNEFPTEKVREIVIKVLKTSTDNAPQDVTLSIIA